MEAIIPSSYRIISIKDSKEAEFSKQFIVNTVAVAFNVEYTAFATDLNTVFIYSNKISKSYIIEIIRDSNIVKLISKPIGVIKVFTHGEYQNCDHIGDYINRVGDPRYIPDMKLEIMNQNKEKELNIRAANVALLIMKYKLKADEVSNNPKKEEKSFFNKKRDCYLLYLTAYNDILSRMGPMKFTDLTVKVREYSCLCGTNLHPAMALEGLIKTGALNSNTMNALVSIPDQMP